MATTRRLSVGLRPLADSSNVSTQKKNIRRNSLAAPVHTLKNLAVLNPADKENVSELPIKSPAVQESKKKRQSTGRRVSFAGSVAIRKFYTNPDGPDSQAASPIMKPLPPDEHDAKAVAPPMAPIAQKAAATALPVAVPASPAEPLLAPASPHGIIADMSLSFMASPAPTTPTRTAAASNLSTASPALLQLLSVSRVPEQRRLSASASVNLTADEKERSGASVSLPGSPQEGLISDVSLLQQLLASPAAGKGQKELAAADQSEADVGSPSASLAELLQDHTANASTAAPPADQSMDFTRGFGGIVSARKADESGMEMTSAYGGILAARKAEESQMEFTSAVGGIVQAATTQAQQQADATMDFTQDVGRIIAARAADASVVDPTMDMTHAHGGILTVAAPATPAAAPVAPDADLIRFDDSIGDRTMDFTASHGGILRLKDATATMDFTGAVGGILQANRSLAAADESIPAVTPDPTMDFTRAHGGGILAVNASAVPTTPEPTMQMTQAYGGIVSIAKPVEVVEEHTGDRTMDMTVAHGGILQSNQSVAKEDDTNTAPPVANATRAIEQSMEQTAAVGGIVAAAQNISMSTPGRNQSVDGGHSSIAAPNTPGGRPAQRIESFPSLLQRVGVTFLPTVLAELHRQSTSQSLTNTSSVSLSENPLAVVQPILAELLERTCNSLKEKCRDVNTACNELESEFITQLPEILSDAAALDVNRAALIRLHGPMQGLKAAARKQARVNFLDYRVMAVEQSRLAALNTILSHLRTDEKTIRTHFGELYRLRRVLVDDAAALQSRLESAARCDPKGLEKVREETQMSRALLASLHGVHNWVIRSRTENQLVVEFPLRATLTVRFGAALSETSRAIDEATLQLAPELASEDSERLTAVLLAGAQLGSQLNPNLLKSTDNLPHVLRQISLVIGRAEKLSNEVRDLQSGHLVRVERIGAGGVVLSGSFTSRIGDRVCNAFEVEFEVDAHYPHSQIQATYRHIFGACSQQHVDAIIPKHNSFGRLTKMFNELLHVARTATS